MENKGGAPEGNNNAQKYKTIEELQTAIDKYFKDRDKHKKPYTMSGLIRSLGIDKNTFYSYSNQELFSPTIKLCRLKIEEQLEECLYRPGNNSGIIFNLKNNYGWRDQQEVKMTNEIENLSTLADMLGFKK